MRSAAIIALLLVVAACGGERARGVEDAETGDGHDADTGERDLGIGDLDHEEMAEDADDASDAMDLPDAMELVDAPEDIDDARDHDATPDETGPDTDVAAAHVATGRVTRDDRAVSVDRTELLPVTAVPVAGLALTVRADGVTVGEGVTDADGAFAIPLAGDGALELVFSATADADGGLAIAILDGQGVAVPSRPGLTVRAERLWTWVAAPASGGDFGVVHVSEADGAGALALIDHLTAARARAREVFGLGGGSLGVLWNPARTPSCLSCFIPRGWGPIVLAGDPPVTFDSGLFLSGAPAAPHHFTPSLAAHELGHWLLDTWSRPPDAGGAHGWTEVVAPPLAWSEGFATFFAQWALSGDGPDPRFFSVQQNVQYWVDLEAIGHGAAASFTADFPAPSAGGGMSQPLNEAVVAAILWDLFDARADVDDDAVTLVDRVIAAVGSARFDLDRGVPGPDLVDLLDALACESPSPPMTSALHAFPWDGAALCP